jgi:hypothetical protein
MEIKKKVAYMARAVFLTVAERSLTSVATIVSRKQNQYQKHYQHDKL